MRQQNHLRLEREIRGMHEIVCMSFLGGKHVRIGRGRLPADRIDLPRV